MELTKQDKKRIAEETRKLVFGIKVEATEYARLYELTYLQELKNQIDEQISTINDIAKSSIEMANNK